MSSPGAWPRRVGVVPLRADCYQERDLSAVLADAVGAGGTAILTHVLSGLGGVGKTQLAAAYAEQCWTHKKVDLLVWISAESREAIVSGYAAARAEIAETANAVDRAVEQDARRFLAWLAETSRRWLIVLDDLPDPVELRDLWPPQTPAGRTLVTTRRRDAALSGHRRQLVEVGLFTPAEAVAYLHAKLADHSHLAEGVRELAGVLDHLPLALAQAAAYLVDRNLTCSEYGHRFSNRRRQLADLVPEPSGLPDDHRATVAATWSLSVEVADQLAPAGLARPLLEFLAVLDPNGIPATVLTTPAALSYLAKANVEVDAEDAWDAVHCLHRLNLVTVDPASAHRSVRVHALVQRATRDQMRASHLAWAARVAADALQQAWPIIERDGVLGQVLRANTDALWHVAETHLWQRQVHQVFFRAGKSLGDTGLPAAAADYFEQLHTPAVERLGPEHPDTLTARGNAAHWRGETGDLVAAVAGLEQVMSDQARVLGPDHPDTLTTRHRFILWQGMAGNTAGLVHALEQLLVDRMRVLGADHPDTLATRSSLANSQSITRSSDDRDAALNRLLADRMRVLGPDHRDTLATRSNIAFWRGEAGDPAGAVRGLEEVLTDQMRVLGHDNRDTLATLGNIAHWRGRGGDPKGALIAEKELLEHYLRVLGPEHPDTLVARNNLAHWRGESGDPAGAISALEELLVDRLCVQGPDHPHTLSNRYNIAHWRGESGDPAGAANMLGELLVDRQRVLGTDHTMSTRQDIAHWLARSGDSVGAVTTLEQLLMEQVRVLGPTHPKTETTRQDLARCRQQPRCSEYLKRRPPTSAWPRHVRPDSQQHDFQSRRTP
ncbi:tetratricopeptide repeat protein [Saccharopolyspora sp. NPDC050642]|uniref:tetratricopeptide repeat protein n=1 Tax=Saccharopolyspora TaxID=1835 RepID=UPI0033CA778C